MPWDIRTETQDKIWGEKPFLISKDLTLTGEVGSGGSVGGHGKAYLSSLILNKVKEKKITDKGHSASELLELRKTFKLKMKQLIITWLVRRWDMERKQRWLM